MAIAFESEAHGSGGAHASPTTYSLTVTSAGSNNVAVLFCNAGNSTTDIHATAVTWDGVSMTQVGTTGTGGTNGTMNMWVLANPTIGTATLSVSWNTSVSADGAAIALAIFSGCAQTGLPDAVTNPSSIFSNVSISVTTVAANAMVVLLSNAGGTAGANTTQIQAAIGFTGYRLATTPGAYSVAETTGSYTSTVGALSLAPFTVPVITQQDIPAYPAQIFNQRVAVVVTK